jgi:hypothetical protein
MKLPKKLIFTLSSGRSGTKHLARILGTLPGVGAHHEPVPNFVEEMQTAQANFGIAQKFLEEKKLPQLSLVKEGTFAEISHMWCKGLLRAWLLREDLPVPDVVVLDRNLRSVALSILRLGTTPERTLAGRQWYIGPSAQSAILKVKDWQKWSDYQLCYWYALEVEARKATLGNWVKSRSGRVCRININELGKWKGVQRLVSELKLPKPSWKESYNLFWLLNEKSNTRGSETPCKKYSVQEIENWEHIVHSDINLSKNVI